MVDGIRIQKKQLQKKLLQKQQQSSDHTHHNAYGLSDHILQLQRTIGNQATIALLRETMPDAVQREVVEDGESEDMSPVMTKKAHLDYIENTNLPGLKAAIKDGNLQDAKSHMAELLSHPLLLFSGSKKQFLKIVGGGAVKGKFGILEVYLRYWKAGKELSKLMKKYYSNPTGYQVAQYYYTKKEKTRDLEASLKGSKPDYSASNPSVRNRQY